VIGLGIMSRSTLTERHMEQSANMSCEQKVQSSAISLLEGGLKGVSKVNYVISQVQPNVLEMI